MPELLLHPAHYDGDTQVVDEVTVEGYWLRPDDVDGFITWCTARGVTVDRLASGGAVLTVDAAVLGRVELGGYAVVVDGEVRPEEADGFHQRYVAAGAPSEVQAGV